jgi:enamine deaminase RidA (YjgF/YER057c/UK114 family)
MTGQLLPTDVSRDARGQAEQIIEQLEALLRRADGDLTRVLRLNVYVADDAATPALDAVIAARFRDAPPAVSLMYTPLARPGALVACDAVAAVSRGATAVEIVDRAAVMPKGGKVFVSGQAKRGPDFAASIRQTMDGLHQAVAHVGLAKNSVVHVKAFITPFGSHALAKEEIEKTYAGGPVPPIVIAEWLADAPTEIELVAAAPALAPTRPDEPAAFLSLPGMSTSPYFSRVATVAAGFPLIYIAGIDGGEAANPRDQWLAVFQRLAFVLRESGGSFRHMVKATYFLSHPKAREALGEIRGVFYDPTRPPAASAIDVKSIGRPKRLVALDMIAVPAKLPPPPPAPAK